MKKSVVIVGILSGLVLGIIALAVILWPKQGLYRTSLDKHEVIRFEDAGFQMEIPTAAPFVSSSSASALVMIHEIERGFQAERGYLIRVHIQRKSRTDMDSSLRFASRPTVDDIQQWRYRMHSQLGVKKSDRIWYVRKDVETPEGAFLFVDGEIRVTEFVESDLLETTRMIESIKLILE